MSTSSFLAANVATGRAGTVTLPQKANGSPVPWPTTWRRLCSLTAAEPRSRVLRVHVNNEQGQHGFYAGDPDQMRRATIAQRIDDAGVLRVRLGENADRVLHADLQSGDYQLPPFGTVHVDVARYSATDDVESLPVTITGEIVDGDFSDFHAFTMTGWCRLPAAGIAEINVPGGAYACDVQADTDGTWTFAAGNGPILEVIAGTYALRDYAKNNVVSPSPFPIACANGVGSQARLAVKNQALTGTCVCKVVFWVR